MGARTVSVVVPATTANLGCAFDCAGIALSLYLRAQATVTEAPGVAVSYQGVNADEIPHDDSNLVVQAMRHAAKHAGATLPGFKLDVQNDIALGVGLGSSAAAIVAGLLLGSELCGAQLNAKDLLRIALEIESHPDNLAAAIHGGMVVSATGTESGEVFVAKAPVPSALDFVAVIPGIPLPTAKARAALPATYSRADVVANLQRTALLTAAFFSGQALTPDLFEDRLHQPYRSPLIPGIAECLQYRQEGLFGIFLSGAGSAVMAIADARDAKSIGEAMVEEFRRKGTPSRALHLKAENHGTQLTVASGIRTFPVPPLT